MFENDRLYFTDDPQIKLLAPYSTMAHWRSEGRGPAYIRVGGKKVAYLGKDLNAWLAAKRVEPTKAT